MNELTYTIKEDQEYIPLINLLQVLNLAQSGGHAKIMVSEGEVKWNSRVELQMRKKVRAGDTVELESFSIKIS